jgi:two-component system, LytTR family, response regulator
MPLKTLIVDDEPIARKVLREELELIDGVEVIGEAADGAAALAKIGSDQPDLVLLDLQMPAMGGLDVVRQLKHSKHAPVIVIVTAYDQHALDAFEAGAIDYLLKPVGHARLSQAVERAKRVTGRQAIERIAQLQEISQEIGATPLASHSRRIVGKIGEEYFLLSADEIYAFQADGDLVWIVTAKRKYLATQTLKDLEHRLKSGSFRRIHRNALVNVDHVRKMSALSSQRWLITMNNDQEFVASKRQARTVRELLTW